MSDEDSFDEWYGIDDERDSTTIAQAEPEENVARGIRLFCVFPPN